MPKLVKVAEIPRSNGGYPSGTIFYRWGERWVWIVETDGSLRYVNAETKPKFTEIKPGKEPKNFTLILNEWHCFDWIEEKKKPKKDC